MAQLADIDSFGMICRPNFTILTGRMTLDITLDQLHVNTLEK